MWNNFTVGVEAIRSNGNTSGNPELGTVDINCNPNSGTSNLPGAGMKFGFSP